MGAVLSLVLLAVILPLVLNEAGELAPWLAKRVVRWTANRLGTSEARERYREEWLGNLEHVPGKFTKLLWAFGLLGSVPRLRWQAVRRERRRQAELGQRSELKWWGAAWLKVSSWWLDRGLAELVPALQRPGPWGVDRPAEVNQIVAALHCKAGETVAITPTVQGRGGLGLTTIAQIVRADRRVLRRFRGRVYWVTLGRNTSNEALAGLVAG